MSEIDHDKLIQYTLKSCPICFGAGYLAATYGSSMCMVCRGTGKLPLSYIRFFEWANKHYGIEVSITVLRKFVASGSFCIFD